MMNSPCAMLITPIWPNVNVRPSAMSSSTAAMLSPMGSWLTKAPMSAQPARPVVALQVRVRLDRTGRGPHLLDLAVRLHQADPRGLGDVLVVAVDGGGALGRLDRDAARGLPHR